MMRINHISDEYMKRLLHAFLRFFSLSLFPVQIKQKRKLTFRILTLSPIAMRFAQIKVGPRWV